MPSGAFDGETVDAVLFRAVLGSAREADSVSLGLPTGPVGVALWFVGVLVFGGRLDRR